MIAIAGIGCSVTPALYQRGVVAADHEIASRAGASILAMGGNAVDAAVATSFTLSVVRPYSCGIGGGGFMIIHFVDDPRFGTRSIAVNYRETTPAAIGPDFYEQLPDGASTRGGNAVAIPGAVAGLLAVLDEFGTLDRATVLGPAIAAAAQGFVVDEHYEQEAQNLIKKFNAEPALKKRFKFVWDRFLAQGTIARGDVMRLPEQARALRLIAEHGPSAFYDGPIAQAIIAAIAKDAGVMAREDLRSYAPGIGEPLVFGFEDNTFLTMGPPSSGGLAMGQVLGILERIGTPSLEPSSTSAHELATRLHKLAEAYKHAFADRARWLGDPEFVALPVQGLLSHAYLDKRAAMFDPSRTLESGAYALDEPVSPIEDAGTSHLSVVDAQGNAVACTETINLAFGSLVAVPEFGFVLNNEMDDFLTRQGVPNAFGLVQSDRNLPAPGKRPLSSMSPTIVLDQDGRVRIVAGASGGPRIITGTLEVVLRALQADEGVSALDIVSAPRFHHQWLPDRLDLEPADWDFDRDDLVGELESLGHKVGSRQSVGNVQLILRRNQGYDAASDPRKGGKPAGP